MAHSAFAFERAAVMDVKSTFMSANSENSKRIAKNTLMLYARMLLLMVISLYTSRVILHALGVIDYGVYNVVGGFVGMFSVVSHSVSASISRFLTFELGRKENSRLSEVFAAAITIQLFISAIIVVLAETVGLWFLTNKMVIPPERMTAAYWVFHLSVATFALTLATMPYRAVIIAHERMSAFAYITIVDGVMKLVIAFAIQASPVDRLVFYAILMALVTVMLRAVYGWYCSRHFKECVYRLSHDRRLIGEMFSFAGWNYIGATAAVLRDQGGNVVINLFAGPAVNAARGVSMSVNRAVRGFVSNFMTALNPQITKSYASGDYDYMMRLLYQGARLSFYMLLLLSLPILLNTHYVLDLWLKRVPDHSVLFTQLVLVFTMSESISHPLITAQLATGRIRDYQLVVGGLNMLNLPVSYVLLRMGCIPETVMVVAIVISQICFLARIYMLRGMIHLRAGEYLRRVWLNVVVVSLLSLLVPLLVVRLLPGESFVRFLLVSVVCVACTSLVIYFVGCSDDERTFVKNKTRQLRKQLFSR